jgi:hypothetical protein
MANHDQKEEPRGTRRRRIAEIVLRKRSAIVLYAVLDVASVWCHFGPLTASSGDSWSSLQVATDPLLVLCAAIALCTKRSWGYLLSFLCSAWVLLDAGRELRVIASTDHLQLFSVSMLRMCWVGGNGPWDLVRWVIALTVATLSIFWLAGAILSWRWSSHGAHR